MFRDRDGWRVQWRDSGKRRSKTFATKREAQIFELQLEAGQVPRNADAITFEKYSKRWLAEYCHKEKAESQWVTDESAIRVHLVPAFGATELHKISKADVLAFRLELRAKQGRNKKPLAVKTVNLVLSLLRKMLSCAVEWELIPVSPAATLKLFPSGQQGTGWWTPDELQHFVRFARNYDRTLTRLVFVAARTGLRRSELAGLTRGQINFDSRLITVDAIWCFKSGKRIQRTKNKSIGYVPFDSEVEQELLDFKMMAPTQQIFPIEAFRHLSQRLQKLAKKVGSKPIRFHDLRHTYGSHLALQGIELSARQRMMRHKTTAMTDRYTHLSPDFLRDQAEKLARKTGTQESVKSEKERRVS